MKEVLQMKNKMKRVLAFVVAFAMVFTLMPGNYRVSKAAENRTISLKMTLANGVNVDNYGFDYTLKRGDTIVESGNSANNVSLSGEYSDCTLVVKAITAGKIIYENGSAINSDIQNEWETGKTFNLSDYGNVNINFQLNNPTSNPVDPNPPQPSENGKMRITCQGNAVTGGSIKYGNNESCENGVVENDESNTYESIDLSSYRQGDTIYFKFEPKEGFALDSGRGVNFHKNGSGTSLTVSNNIYSYTFSEDPANTSYELEFGFVSGNGQGGGSFNQGFSWNLYNEQLDENDVFEKVEYKKNDANEWSNVTGSVSLDEGDSITVKYTLKTGYKISSEGFSAEYWDDNNSNSSYFNQSQNISDIITALTGDNGYTFTFAPEAVKDADGNSLFDDDNTQLRLQFTAIRSFEEKNELYIFMQEEVGRTADGKTLYGDREPGEEAFSFSSELMFRYNDNSYGSQGTSTGYKENNGDTPIEIKYPSAVENTYGVMVSRKPSHYIFYEAGGYKTGETKNELILDDELIDEVYIDKNGNGTFDKTELVQKVQDGDRSYYKIELDAADKYSVLIRKGMSPISTIGWSYDEIMKDTDEFVEHGKVYVTEVKHGNDVILGGIHFNEDGTVVLENGLPIYDTNRINEYEGFRCDISATGGGVMVANGDEVTIMLIPTYGHQLVSASLNGTELEPQDQVGTYKFTLYGNFHLGSSFVQANDITVVESEMVSEITIENGENATEMGNLQIEVSDSEANTGAAEGKVSLEEGEETEVIANLDMNLYNMVSKGNNDPNAELDDSYWVTQITEFDDPIKVGITLPDVTLEEGERLAVVREHNGVYTELEGIEFEDGTINIPTNQFSTYTIVKASSQPPCTHTETVVKDAKAATCIADGYTGDTYCKLCGVKISSGTVIKAAGHKYDAGKVTKEPTVDAEGVKTYTCTVCGATKTEAIAKLTKPETPAVNVSYHTHIQNIGDAQGVKTNGQMAGTSGQSKRLENIWIKVDGNSNLGIQYSTHCQNYGWMPWSANGEANGTSGESKRLEAIKIQLTGADADKYDVYYRVHAQNYGWLAWAKNGEAAGTEGLSKRLEGIQVVIVPKGEAAPSIIYGNIISIMPQAFIKK